MAIEVKIPAMGESITSGIIAVWHVKEGDFVTLDQLVYELETDKITSEGNADAAGIITLKAVEGDEVEIGQVIAIIDETAEPAASPPSTSGVSEARATTEDPTRTVAVLEPGDAAGAETPPVELPGTDPTSGDVAAAKASPSAALSPAVKRLASETGIDTDAIVGTGKAGRVTKGDLFSAAAAGHGKKSPAGTVANPTTTADIDAAVAEESPRDKRRKTRKKMTPLRRRISERLVAAQQTAAILSTFNEVDMSAVIALRKKYQIDFTGKHGVKLGFMSFFVKATVHALNEVPALNTQIEADEIIQNHFYDIGVAISTPRGLLVPVIRNADRLSFAQIERDINHYAAKAREGKMTIDDLQGGVFTISNGGIFGSMLSTPILNQPQSGILGMHAITDRPIAVGGSVEVRPMMYLAISYDHRIVDGREAVTFLIKVKEAIEDPTRLLLFGIQ